MSKKEKLRRIKKRYALWDKRSRLPNTSECEGCSSSSGDGCHGDGECGGDGE